MPPILVAHIGAGNHSGKNEKQYRKLLSEAVGANRIDGLDAILAGSKVLESSPIINSGYGSSLNILGKVSNDASILQYSGNNMTRYNVVHNIDHKYPISEVFSLYDKIDTLYRTKKYDQLGMVKPKVIDYTAKKLVYERLGEEVIDEDAISAKEEEMFQLFKEGLLLETSKEVTDTIGLIHLHDDITTIASSSGGNFLKLPGRVGCAGVIGAGIAHRVTEKYGISVMCSGNGEDIVMMSLATFVADICGDGPIDVTVLHRQLSDKWNTIDTSSQKLYVGVVVILNNKEDHTQQLFYYHTTETFFFAFNRGKEDTNETKSVNGGGSITKDTKGVKTKIVASKLQNQPYVIGEYFFK